MEDIELWLYEVEGHLASDDYGKDLTSVQNLQKKQALLEADVAAHQVPGFSHAGVTLTLMVSHSSRTSSMGWRLLPLRLRCH